MNHTFLQSKTAVKLYKTVKDLPIIDYHCHLSPKEIAEDHVFSGIYEMWLQYDHYKWRLMRATGISEDFITGSKPEREKFRAYIAALQYAANHPLYHWSKKELEDVFGITLPLRIENADAIYDAANASIQKKQMKPSDLFRLFKVEALCTTDDPADSLEYHQRISESNLPVKVFPSFRTDNLLRVLLPGYRDYIKKLGISAGREITDLDSLKAAVSERLRVFKENGCLFSDMGIPEFPQSVSSSETAAETFRKIINGEHVSEKDADGFVGYMTVYLAKLYKENDMVMQLHMGVVRDSNSVYKKSLGDNVGCDTANDVIPAESLIQILDSIYSSDVRKSSDAGEVNENSSAIPHAASESGMPKTILYTLNEADVEKMASIAYAFPNVVMGASWWFNDHESGIKNQLTKVSELGTLATFPGMLTDSRSFLSYTRHDYFRRIMCSMVASWVDAKTYDALSAEALVRMLAYGNTKEYFK